MRKYKLFYCMEKMTNCVLYKYVYLIQNVNFGHAAQHFFNGILLQNIVLLLVIICSEHKQTFLPTRGAVDVGWRGVRK